MPFTGKRRIIRSNFTFLRELWNVKVRLDVSSWVLFRTLGGCIQLCLHFKLFWYHVSHRLLWVIWCFVYVKQLFLFVSLPSTSFARLGLPSPSSSAVSRRNLTNIITWRWCTQFEVRQVALEDWPVSLQLLFLLPRQVQIHRMPSVVSFIHDVFDVDLQIGKLSLEELLLPSASFSTACSTWYWSCLAICLRSLLSTSHSFHDDLTTSVLSELILIPGVRLLLFLPSLLYIIIDTLVWVHRITLNHEELVLLMCILRLENYSNFFIVSCLVLCGLVH